jgi:predicted tellurium resistance membrane protein TerC
MDFFLNPEMWMSLLTLTMLEIVLGVDNIVFITILSGKLPAKQQPLARKLGLAAALLTRLGLLASLKFLSTLTAPIFTMLHQEISGRDLVLIVGGAFLLYKSIAEIREKLSGESHDGGRTTSGGKAPTFGGIIFQIMMMDIIFSLDSIITAVGIATDLRVMMSAVVIAVLIMMVAVEPINYIINKYPTIKMLAIAFLVLVGLVLVADGFEIHIPKACIYTAMFFSMGVEILNINVAKAKQRAGGSH